MNNTVNSHLKTSAKLAILAGIGGSGDRYPVDTLRKETSPSFSDADQENA